MFNRGRGKLATCPRPLTATALREQAMADPADTTNPIMRQCSVEGCSKHVLAKGWCRKHYSRMRRRGELAISQTQPGAALEWLLEYALPERASDCLLWPFTSSHNGYGVVRLSGQIWPAHRLVCHLVYGQAPFERAEAAHSCGVRACVNPQHIRWATHLENIRDKYLHGTQTKGEAHSLAKLTDDAVRLIRRGGKSDKYWADRIGCSESTIKKARQGRTWAHVTTHKRRDAV